MIKKIVQIIALIAMIFGLGFIGFDVYRIQKESEIIEKELAEYAARPEMPIEISYRSAILGPGIVAIFKNVSGRHLAVVATFSNPTLKKTQSYRLDLSPNNILEFGHSEGWVFASGDTVGITHNDYKNLNVVIP